ncbi:holin [Burkholderia phage Mica]|uniref:Holin class II n=1 Tax=Burkholderia phage Mica TaxID=2767579 RepID=A0A873WF43_9CAUD|nr:holin [Burkholderia phage Mica]QPB08678.1 holin class II [Burkholderia phage Mica]
MDQQTGQTPFLVAKLMGALAAIGISSWGEFAAFVAAAYSLLLIGEWVWRHVARPFCVWRGWMKQKAIGVDDADPA